MSDEPKNVDNDFHAYIHTYCFGPGTRVMVTTEKEGEEIEMALCSVLQQWNSGEGMDTLYFALPANQEDLPLHPGVWINQEDIIHNQNGVRLLKVEDAQ